MLKRRSHTNKKKIITADLKLPRIKMSYSTSMLDEYVIINFVIWKQAV
jgi:hypothetical protein